MPRSTASRAITARPHGFPGFRPGKVPPRVVKQRFRRPDSARRGARTGPARRRRRAARAGLEPVDTPDIRDVVVEEGQPLKFTAHVRHGAGLRSAATTRRCNCAGRRRRRRRAPSTRRCSGCGSARRDSSWSRSRPVERGDTVVVDLVREAGGEAADTPSGRHHRDRRLGQPAGLRRRAHRHRRRRRRSGSRSATLTTTR